MSFASISVGGWIGIGLGAASMGMGAASAAGAFTPSQPNLGSASRRISDVQARLLPQERAVQGSANIGELSNQLLPGYKKKTDKDGNTIYVDKHGTVVPASQALADFTGYGAGQTQATLADQTAAGNLALAQKYDPLFIQSALEQEQLANPQGVQARKLEDALIQKQVADNNVSPVASTLQKQVQDQLAAGKGLDAFDQATLNNAVQDALASRGGGDARQNFSDALTTGFAGNQRQLAGIQKAESMLGSGTTPADVQYRREQQNLSNLSSETSGQTPVTQFHQLSGAQSGPTPSVSGSPLPLLGNTQGMSASAVAQQYANTVNTPNPWFTGLTAATNAANVGANIFSKS